MPTFLPSRSVTMLERLEPRALFSANWTVVPATDASPYGNSLGGVAAISATDAWAVGSTQEVDDTQSKTLIEHWNGSGWTIVPSPNPGHNSINSGNVLSGVSAVTSNNVWAVGYYWQDSLFQTQIQHWNGSSWSVVASPNPEPQGYNVLYGVKAVSANDVWAVGYVDGENQFGVRTLIEHWNGSAWTVVPSPNLTTGNVLESVTALSSTDAWAVGTYYDPTPRIWKTLTEHWNGEAWSIVSSPSPGNYLGNSLGSVTAVSSNNVWAVGSYDEDGASETLIEHWNGTQWTQVTSPNLDLAYGSQNVLNSVTATGANSVWAVGFTAPHTSLNQRSLTVHWDGSNWSVVQSPTPGQSATLNGIAVAGGRLLAVGAWSQYGNSYDQGMIVPQTLGLILDISGAGRERVRLRDVVS